MRAACIVALCTAGLVPAFPHPIPASNGLPPALSFVAAAATTVKAGSLVIDTPWMRATPPGAKVAAGYLRITNEGSEPDRFLGGEVAFADRLEIHQMTMTDSVMQMRQLTNGLEIKPGETVELKPGAYHLMFVGVKEQLKQGSRLKATLRFEKTGKVDVEFDVLAIGAEPPERAPGR